MEEWKDIEGYEGKYKISNLGEVYSIQKNMLLSKRLTSYKYYEVKLYDKKKLRKKVHILVAKSFLPNPNNLEIVHHIDGDKLNNKVDNLLWMSRSEHMKLHRNNDI